MGCSCSRRHPHLIMSFIFLLVSISTQVRFMAEGRTVFKHIQATQMGGEEKVIVRTQIGSRPPRCERRCSTCGHCEAVQVPAVPQNKSRKKDFFVVSARGEDNSNYKPMSWKCKCGDMIFNP